MEETVEPNGGAGGGGGGAGGGLEGATGVRGIIAGILTGGGAGAKLEKKQINYIFLSENILTKYLPAGFGGSTAV